MTLTFTPSPHFVIDVRIYFFLNDVTTDKFLSLYLTLLSFNFYTMVICDFVSPLQYYFIWYVFTYLTLTVRFIVYILWSTV